MASYIPHDAVLVHLHNCREPLVFYDLNGLTAEKLCYKVAANITYQNWVLSNRDITSFQLVTKDTEAWLSPSRDITRGMELLFRLRYQFRRDKDGTGLSMAAMEYYYYQCREDFLQGHSWEMFEDQEVMGLAVMDMMRYTLENNININEITKRLKYERYLPHPLPSRLAWVHKKKTVKRRIKEGLHEFAQKDWQIPELKRTYIAHFEKKHANLGMEMFQHGTQKIKISGDNGIEVTEGESVKTFDFCDITDVMAMHTNGKIDVTINLRKGQPVTLCEMKSEKAESLISLLDGYYRLLVDYYHFLCDEYKSPMLASLLEARCHGPISRSIAVDKLKAASNGTYLIRQNPESGKLGSFILNLCYDNHIKNYLITVDSDDKVGLTDTKFSSLKELIHEYRASNNDLDVPLKLGVYPDSKDRSLLVKRAGSGPDIQRSPKAGFKRDNNGVWIHEDDVKRLELLGEGVFTKIYKGTYKYKTSKDTTSYEEKTVAIKYIASHEYEKKYEKVFFSIADSIMFLDNPHIVRIYGVRNYMLVMEYVPYGSLNTYLSGLSDVTIEELYHAAIQVAEALEYLEDKSVVHGSICAKNVLVASKPGDSTSLTVKLADPMFGTKYYSLKSQSEARLSRVPWTPPEHLVSARKVTLALDKFSYGVLCWEIFCKGREPFKDNRTEDIRHKYIKGQRPTLSILPDDLCAIIKACWHQDPKERPAFKSVLRDLRTLLNRLHESVNLNETTENYRRAWIRSVSETLYADCSQSPTCGNGDSGVGIPSSGRNDTVHPPSDADSDIANGDAQLSPGPLPAEGPVFDDIEEELEDHMIAPDALDLLGDPIGTGHYGVVYKAIWKKYPNIPEMDEEVAIKTLPILFKNNRTRIDDFKREIISTVKLDSTRVIRVKGISIDPSVGLMMVMEYLPLGAVNIYLRKNLQLPEKTLCRFSKQIAEGMHYLEEHNVVHRDLAARNILVVTTDSADSDKDLVKISDFGLARVMTGNPESMYYRQKSETSNPILWHCPEGIKDKIFTSKGDVWGYGILLWEIFTYGSTPSYKYRNVKVPVLDVFPHILNGLRLEQPPRCHNEIYKVMRKCWSIKPEERPTFVELTEDFNRVLAVFV